MFISQYLTPFSHLVSRLILCPSSPLQGPLPSRRQAPSSYPHTSTHCIGSSPYTTAHNHIMCLYPEKNSAAHHMQIFNYQYHDGDENTPRLAFLHTCELTPLAQFVASLSMRSPAHQGKHSLFIVLSFLSLLLLLFCPLTMLDVC